MRDPIRDPQPAVPKSVTHEAGRELDALIEEYVFGATWRPAPKEAPTPPDVVEWLQRREGGAIYAERKTDGRVLYFGVEPYSTDIAAAWAVVEELRGLARAKNLWGPNLAIHIPVQEGGRWVVELHNDLYGGMAEPHTHDTQWSAGAETAPLAICLAALKAMEAR